MEWIEVSILTDGEAAEVVAEVLRPFAYNHGVVIEQLGDPRSQDPYALEPRVTVKIYLPADDSATPGTIELIENSLYHLNRLYPVGEPKKKILADEDWGKKWRENFKPFRIGRHIWIQPSWEPLENNRSDDIVIKMDPGMAFGTGLHPTTQMCLRVLEESIREGASVLDVGTGTGILGIAAVKLGSEKVLAFDTDPVAARSARDNAIVNGVADKMFIYQGNLDSSGNEVWDIILVNILAPVIRELLLSQGLIDKLAFQGRLVLSGIIDDQVDLVIEAIELAAGQVIDRFAVRDWICLVVEK